MSHNIELGRLIYGYRERDAVHFAVVPVIASEPLVRGQRVKLTRDTKDHVSPAETNDYIGIVDPFLYREEVERGCKFFMVLKPGSVTSMRHHWNSPDFSAATDAESSERWLRNFIESSDMPEYDVVMAAAVGDPVSDIDGYGRAYSVHGSGEDSYLLFNGRDAHCEIPDEFWDHVEMVTGRRVPVRVSSFSCSC